MATKAQATPSRTLLPSPMDRTPPSSTRKRALNELSINLPPRPHSAQEFTTPEHPSQYKRYRKVSETLSAPLSASSLTSSNSKRESPGEDPVWGPEVEAAFMSAIKSIPKLGRRKICIGSKPCGRNELIADFIYRRTGKVRTRKQVSSHIQVLKHIRRDDAEFLALVADGKDAELDEASLSFEAKDMEQFGPIDNQTVLEQEYQLSQPLDTDASPLYFARRSKPQSLEAHSAQLQVEEFCIWATKRDAATAEDRVSHVYTGFDKESSLPVAPIDAVSDWALRFPCLPSLLPEVTAQQLPIFHVRSSLNLPESLDLDGEQQVVLRTQLSMTCLSPRMREQWVCTTRVYTMGNQVLELKQKVSMEQIASLEPQSGKKDKSSLKVAVPFATDFWAAFLAGLASFDQSLQNLDDDERIIKKERDSHNAVSGITVVQEIATAETTLDVSKRLSLLIWEFVKTSNGEEGETLITRIVPADHEVRQQMRAPALARSVSQSHAVPRKKASRPQLNLAHGLALQRSQSVAAVPTQSTFSAAPSRPLSRQNSLPLQQTQVHPAYQTQSHHAPTYYSVEQSHSASRATFSSSGDLQIPYTVLSQPPSSSSMARSFSAPTWTHAVQPSPYSLVDLNSWNDSFIDWTLPESAGYLQSEFQVSSDDFFTTTPSRPHSVMPQSYGMEHTTSTAGTDICDDDAMPRLGFFPLTNY